MLLATTKGQIEGLLVGKATAMIVMLTAIAALVAYGRQAGHSTLALSPLLLPFAISGLIVLAQLWKEWRPALSSAETG
jgi:hypothetical protein